MLGWAHWFDSLGREGYWEGRKEGIGFSGQLVGLGALVDEAEGHAQQCTVTLKHPGRSVTSGFLGGFCEVPR